MDKIKILISSIIVALIFGGSIESHGQLIFANESCRALYMSSTFNKESSSLLSSNFVHHNSEKKGLTTFEKILNIPIGIIFGSLGGYLIGTSLPQDRSVENIVDGIKGGLIGAFTGPFVNYEIMSAMKGARNPSNKWCFSAGGNIILPNYEDAVFTPGYSIGISRYYPMNNVIALQGNLAYQARQFSLPSQKILYGMFSFDHEVRTYDIDFSVGYIDISLLLNFKLLTLRNSTLNIAVGPSLSLELYDNTKFHFIKLEENQNDFDFTYIMDEPDPLFGYPAMVYQLELQRGKWIGQLGFHHSMTDTDEIYPLISKTRLRTLELSIGYKL